MLNVFRNKTKYANFREDDDIGKDLLVEVLHC